MKVEIKSLKNLKLQRFKKRSKKINPCDICLIVYNAVLLHTKQQNLIAQPDEPLLKLTPSELAKAARRLLPNTTKQQRVVLGLPAPTKQQCIALALPNEEFVSTTLQLPAIAMQNLKSTVSLQLPTLLPGITEPLLLAVQPTETPDKLTTALWIPAKRAEELYQAFAEEDLFLTTILPRALVTLPATCETKYQIYDEDENTITYVEWQETTLQRWIHFPKVDLALPEFRTQLDQALASSDHEALRINKTSLDDWADSPMPSPIAYAYAFTPPGASLHINRANQRRRRQYIYLLATVFLLITIGGIGVAHFYKENLKKELSALKAGLEENSELPSKIQQIEDEIAPIKAFPRQDVIAVLTKLNALIPKDSWLESFRIEAGKVEIEGYSQNVSQLLNTLAHEESFEKPDLSRTIRGEVNRKEDNFGIHFNLKGIDIPDYWMRYIHSEEKQ